MQTEIREVLDGGEGRRLVAIYSLPPKKALIAFVERERGNYNTWEYPNAIPGMFRSAFMEDRWYIEDKLNKRTLCAVRV